MRFIPNKRIDAEFIFICFAEAAATGSPYRIYRFDRDGRTWLVVTEDEYEFYPDGYARACRMNREISISEEDAKIFRLQVSELRRIGREAKRAEEERQEREAAETERRRVLDEQVSRGSPGHQSVIKVHESSEWERVADLDGSTWPASRQCVVKHVVTGSLWSCRYSIRDDDSDAGLSQVWEEVEARTVTVVKYEPRK
jgi:hypothetical protein